MKMNNDIKDSLTMAVTLLIAGQIITEEEFTEAKEKGHDGLCDLFFSKIDEIKSNSSEN